VDKNQIALRDFALRYPGAHEDFPWGERVVSRFWESRSMELEVAQAVSVLERTPAALAALLGGLPESWVTANEGADTFSPRDVLGHLIHGEETDWIPRAEIILSQGEDRPFTPFDRFGFRGWLERTTTAELLERLLHDRAR
jgi:hypothetical protein